MLRSTQEMAARRRSLRYLERLRIVHALVTVALTVALLAWVLLLWQQGAATTGDVILVCTLGLSVLHATRDLAVALVDVTQHTARFAEALADAAGAAPAVRSARRQDAGARRHQRHASRKWRSPIPTVRASSTD